MLTTKGIAGAVSNVTRRRQKRFYTLLALAATVIEKCKLNEPNYSPPLFQTVEQYMKEHACLDNEVLQKVWLTQTTVRSRLIDAHMSVSKCAKVTKVDRSQKFRS
ncbi:hypothetical protein PPTG_23400 [Phytophthora nicotianae INRA-310]|uniref:Uncharacterized protein n=3 Tax=Phytophthora nicotianae TaxID=4792 RepID=W2PZH2_PHYN3|nr:hypothetical protein PPTG_23400 [Phytophthora nicotianae INRA-310]ETN06056.1 hypothetical protein PPTG_23400 [Phytophthora nicotianae INRA-310]